MDINPKIDITTGFQTVNAVGPVTPSAGADVSGVMPTDYASHLQVSGLTPGAAATVLLEDSLNSFSSSLGLETFRFLGQIDDNCRVHLVRRHYELACSRFGVAA